MARRPSATAALLLILSLLAVAHCRTVAADHAAEPESTAAVAVSDENGLSSDPNPGLPAVAGPIATEEEEVLPAEQEQRHGIEFLRLPSHRRLHRHRRPCSLPLHHGERREAARRLDLLPGSGAEARVAEEVKPVAEPDPDRSLPDSDGSREPSLFADSDGHDGERAAAVKKEVLRRWLHFHFHHGMRRHRLHHVDHHDDEEEEEEAAPEGMKMKRFHLHHEEEDEEKNMVRKWFRHADEHDHDEDSDDEDEEIEEMVRRRFRKAIMKRGFSHGHGHSFFHHDHTHRHTEEAEEKAAGGDEQSGVMAWIKALMNRF